MLNQSVAFWGSSTVLAIAFALNQLYAEPLYRLGESLILWGQQYSSPPLDAFFIFFTFLIEPFFVIACLVVAIILLPKKLEATVISIAVLFNTYLFMVMKAFLTSPRPFWTHKHIRNIGYYCPKDYGSPSGHTEFAVFIFCIYLFHFNRHSKVTASLLGLAVVVFVMLSRLYLGGHSLDQVIFGFIVAACFSLMYQFGGIRQKIGESLLNFHKANEKRKVIFLILSALSLAGVVFWRNLNREQQFLVNFDRWKENFKSKCSFEISWGLLNESAFLAESIIISFSLGMYLAFSSMQEIPSISHILSGNWTVNRVKYGAFSNSLLTIISVVSLLLPTIVALPVWVMLKHSYLAKYLIGNGLALISPYFLGKVSWQFMQQISLVEVPEVLDLVKGEQELGEKGKNE